MGNGTTRNMRLNRILIPCAALLVLLLPAAWADDVRRDALWREVDRQVGQMHDELGIEALSPGVRAALAAVARERFVPEAQRRYAYDNRPLPIGYGQTISQPLIVAIMTELLGVGPGARVLEVGTGSGYQAAVLDALGTQVFSIEIIPELGERARRTLDASGHGDVATRVGDGYFGWEDEAPFDAVVVTAAAEHIPPPLIRQLKPGGRMLIPVGSRYFTQQLVIVERDASGAVSTRELIPVTFVPLTGKR